MNQELLRRHADMLNALEDRDYLLAKIAYEIAPTLAGIKPSSLLAFSRQPRDLYCLWQEVKEAVGLVLNISFFELKKTDTHILVLFYNSEMLGRILADEANREFLAEAGYPAGVKVDQLLPILRSGFAGRFPHEIGLLLGIPRDDVISFIRNDGAGCLFCGYWKVYHNPRRANSVFQAYDRAKIRVMKRMSADSKRYGIHALKRVSSA